MNIPTPKVSEILMEEFMKPMNLSAYALAKAINVPTSRIQDILHNRRAITMDTSIRLGAFFHISDMFFINIQNEIDRRNIKKEIAKELITIKAVSVA
ncbi:MAG: HigA family addiction module antitoxin [Bacilli bacterium]|nr:HigA family addiction module antitoxin [Bacilli bacterium]